MLLTSPGSSTFHRPTAYNLFAHTDTRPCRVSGNGHISQQVQAFLYHSCLNHSVCLDTPSLCHSQTIYKTLNVPDNYCNESVLDFQVARRFPPSKVYVRNLLKRVILEAEAEGEEVIDVLYKALIIASSSHSHQVKSIIHCWNNFAFKYDVPV